MGFVFIMIAPLIPSHCSFFFVFGHGESFFGGFQHPPSDGCSTASCSFSVLSVCPSTLPSWTRRPEKQLYWTNHNPPAPLDCSCKIAMWASCISIMLVIFITLIKVLNFFLSWESIQFLLGHSGKDWEIDWGAIISSWYKSNYHFFQEWRTIILFSSRNDISTLNRLKLSHSQASLASFPHQLKEDGLTTGPDGMVTLALVSNRIINEFLPSWKFPSISNGWLRDPMGPFLGSERF